jgi:Undecaprenyl pyrophosphate synthase
VGLYDRYLAVRLGRGPQLPETVALVITERDLLVAAAYETLESFLGWAFEFDAGRVVVYVSLRDEGATATLERAFERLDTPREMAVRTPGDQRRAEAPVQVSLGLGGKHEFASAVRSIAEDVDAGRLGAAAVTETHIEDRLVFPEDPDLVVKTGDERLSDFMIWQSVYAELHFTDINWQNFRRRDYLRALRDYQTRQRRFGE